MLSLLLLCPRWYVLLYPEFLTKSRRRPSFVSLACSLDISSLGAYTPSPHRSITPRNPFDTIDAIFPTERDNVLHFACIPDLLCLHGGFHRCLPPLSSPPVSPSPGTDYCQNFCFLDGLDSIAWKATRLHRATTQAVWRCRPHRLVILLSPWCRSHV